MDEKKLKKTVESARLLNEIQDMDILLERLLSEVRHITNADAGSIYIHEQNMLTIKCAQNETLEKLLDSGQKVPCTPSLSGWDSREIGRASCRERV